MPQLPNKAHSLYVTNKEKTIVRLDTKNFSTLANISLNGCILYLTVKTNIDDVTNIFEVNSGTITTTDGTAILTIPKATMDTVVAGDYWYELTIQNSLGKPYQLTTSIFSVSESTV